MGIRGRLFAYTYDRQLAGTEKAGLRAMREELIPRALGDVLEIGGGTGANLALYNGGVESLTVTEPAPPMLRRLERRASQYAPGATIMRAPAEDLPFNDDSFDTVVSTLVLCGVDDQPRALRELHRVLRPGGTFVFLEHVRSDEAKQARMQDRLNFICRLVACCDCNRPTLRTIEETGFEITDLRRGEMPKAPPFVRPMIAGTARI